MDTRSFTILALCAAACAEPLSEALETLGPMGPLKPLQRALKARSDAFDPYANEFTQEYEPVAFAAIPLGGPVPIIAVLSENPITQAKQLQQAMAATLKQTFSKPEYQNLIQTGYQKPYEYARKPYEYPQFTTEYPKELSSEYPKHYSSIEFAKPYTTLEYTKPYPVEYTKQYPVEYTKQYPAEYTKQYPVEYTKPYTEYAPYRSVEYAKPYREEYVKPYREEYVKPYVEEYVKPHASVEAPTILYARPRPDGGYTYSRRPLKKRNLKRPQKQKPVILRVRKYRVIRSRRSGY